MSLDVNPETENVVSAIYKIMSRTVVPALQVCSGWGDINPPNPRSETMIKYYISNVMLFMDYLESELYLFVHSKRAYLLIIIR